MDVTVIISSSPIISHPSTEIIDETIKSIRERLPESQIIIMCDGVREEQERYRERYERYVLNLRPDNKTTILTSPIFLHQAGMTRLALEQITTPYILFVEHDTPLCGEIPWGQMCRAIDSTNVNVIRLMYEAFILEEHKYLMFGEDVICGVPLTKTRQWSQRPHLADTQFYREMLQTYFPESSRTFIEDKIYGIIEVAYNTYGMEGWNKFKLWIYTPEGDMKRSLNLDGRGSDPKYELKFD